MRSHPLKDRWQEAEIDPKIRPLVQVLNRPELGIKTVASCQGHITGIRPPYVYFRCPVPIAANIQKLILFLFVSGQLRYEWSLDGRFDGQFRLCFSLESRCLHEAHGHLIPPLLTHWIGRRRIDADLARLAEDIGRLLDRWETGANQEIPDPYDSQNHSDSKNTITALYLRARSYWVRMGTYRARFLGFVRKQVATFNTRNEHDRPPNTGKKRTFFLIVIFSLLSSIPAGGVS